MTTQGSLIGLWEVHYREKEFKQKSVLKSCIHSTPEVEFLRSLRVFMV